MKADIQESGKTGEEAMKMMTPEAIRAETGRASEEKSEDKDK